MIVPDGIDRDDVIACIVEQYGQQPLVHPDPEYMRRYVQLWSKRRQGIWTKLLATTQLEYNPIDNYDRTEEITEHRETGRKTTNTVNVVDSDSATDETTGDTSTVHEVSAENANAYQPDNKDTGSESGSMTHAGHRNSNTSGNIGEAGTDSFTHVNHTHGNIGITTSQQMIAAERDIVRYSLIEEIAADYRDAFCLSIY